MKIYRKNVQLFAKRQLLMFIIANFNKFLLNIIKLIRNYNFQHIQDENTKTVFIKKKFIGRYLRTYEFLILLKYVYFASMDG